jgi:uncharacterized membrane protein YsdA (DUF1294 family)
MTMSMQKYCSTLAASGANYIIFWMLKFAKKKISQKKKKICEEKWIIFNFFFEMESSKIN